MILQQLLIRQRYSIYTSYLTGFLLSIIGTLSSPTFPIHTFLTTWFSILKTFKKHYFVIVKVFQLHINKDINIKKMFILNKKKKHLKLGFLEFVYPAPWAFKEITVTNYSNQALQFLLNIIIKLKNRTFANSNLSYWMRSSSQRVSLFFWNHKGGKVHILIVLLKEIKSG